MAKSRTKNKVRGIYRQKGRNYDHLVCRTSVRGQSGGVQWLHFPFCVYVPLSAEYKNYEAAVLWLCLGGTICDRVIVRSTGV